MLIPLDIRFFPILEDRDSPPGTASPGRQHGLHAAQKFSAATSRSCGSPRGTSTSSTSTPSGSLRSTKTRTFHKGDRRGELSCNPDGKNPGDIWLFRNVKHNHEEQTIHPCQFPEDLIARIVLTTTNKGAVVLDPYMGPGTVAVVAMDHKRHFLGAELDDVPRRRRRRLAGVPDKEGLFANLKTLRDYCARTGRPVKRYSFDVQVGDKPTDRSVAKIYPESHHLQEMEARLEYEESAFAADLRGENRPVDAGLNGKRRQPEERTLFDD